MHLPQRRDPTRLSTPRSAGTQPVIPGVVILVVLILLGCDIYAELRERRQ